MALIRITGTGKIGLNRDLSQHELPNNAWSDCKNIRFLDGYAHQFLGHSEVYNSPTDEPQHVIPCNVLGNRSWIYATPTKQFVVNVVDGDTVHTDITHETPRAGIANQWTSTLLSGTPILNCGDTSNPMAWDQDITHKFVDLPNWQSGVSCKSMRSFKNFLIALNVTKDGNNYPFMVKWSHPAEPGTLPNSWDESDATKLAGEVDIAEGYDPIVDGLTLRGSFMIYKENSVFRMDFVGGNSVFSFTKVLGMSGALNRNCIAELETGYHIVLTSNDIIIHDGNSSHSILDKITRRWFFQNIDAENYTKAFLFLNPFFNECFICYPSIGSSVCDQAIVYNYHDKVVSMRDMPNANHANFGPIDYGFGRTWETAIDTWESVVGVWDGPDYVPSNARCLVASADTKLYMLDAANSFNGIMPTAYIERRGLSFGEPEVMKLVRGIRARITGSVGDNISITVGRQDDPWQEPQWGDTMTHTIGYEIADDSFVTGRYIAIRIDSDSAAQWRLDSFDFDVVLSGSW